MNCPKYSCVSRVKSGIIKDRQRYKCKDCGCNYTIEVKSTGKSKLIKKQALHLYLEGLSFRAIGRILGVSNVSVLNWIRCFGKEVQALHSASQAIKMVEVDEMHTYVGSTKTATGSGLLLIDMGIEDRRHPTAGAKENNKCLRAARIRHNRRSQMKFIASDYWKLYESIIPKEKHIQTKAETFIVEGYNSPFRHFLARMRRKSKCYSKTMEMLNLSLLLLMHYRNQRLSIFY
jgi:transposase-like protein/IS1 family transposase